ncbi:MAG: hypothetical protein ACT4P7_03595 [Gemmatimonadaceae bacterium]
MSDKTWPYRALFAVSPLDAVTFATVFFLIVGTGLFASWLPARRVTRADAATVLHR